jgi:hypothetical protein
MDYSNSVTSGQNSILRIVPPSPHYIIDHGSESTYNSLHEPNVVIDTKEGFKPICPRRKGKNLRRKICQAAIFDKSLEKILCVSNLIMGLCP